MRSQAARAVAVCTALMAGGGVMIMSPGGSLACGFHDDVAFARGMLNWVYPDSLHVVGATARAVTEARLPHPHAETGPDPFGARYRSLVAMLARLTDELGAAPPPSPAFALLLVEPMLWIRFHSDDGALRAQVHAAGPQPGDLVVIASRHGAQALVDGRVSIREAHQQGLLRFYGADGQQTQFLAAYGQVGRNRAAATTDFSSNTSQ
jgi:hypothetical protein